MFFYTLLLFAPNWIPTLIGSFARAGVMASGYPKLDPATIASQGIDLAIAMFSDVGGLISLVQLQPWVYVAPLLVVIAFASIAGLLLTTLIESYFVIGAGVLLLGFGGSRWTATFAEGYLLYAMRVGVKLFVLYLLIGIGMTLPTVWLDMLRADLSVTPRLLYEVMGSSLVFAMVAFRVPKLASGMLGHRASFTVDRAYAD